MLREKILGPIIPIGFEKKQSLFVYGNCSVVENIRFNKEMSNEVHQFELGPNDALKNACISWVNYRY